MPMVTSAMGVKNWKTSRKLSTVSPQYLNICLFLTKCSMRKEIQNKLARKMKRNLKCNPSTSMNLATPVSNTAPISQNRCRSLISTNLTGLMTTALQIYGGSSHNEITSIGPLDLALLNDHIDRASQKFNKCSSNIL